MLDSIAQKYIEAASASIPLRHICAMVTSLVIITCSDRAGALVKAIFEIPLFDLLDLAYWNSLDLSLSALYLALTLVILGVLAERCLAVSLFRLAARFFDYRNKVLVEYRKLVSSPASTESRESRLKLLEGAAKPTARRFSRSVCISQMSFTSAFTFLLWGGAAIDFLIGAALLTIGVLRTVETVKIFISEYFPIIALRNVLQGLPPPAEIADLDG